MLEDLGNYVISFLLIMRGEFWLIFINHALTQATCNVTGAPLFSMFDKDLT